MREDRSVGRELRSRLTLAGLRSVPIRYYLAALFFIGLAVGPFVAGMGTLLLLQWASAFYFIMFVISWDFVSGTTGQVSFGHTLFFTAGGYTTAMLNLYWGVDPLLGIVAGTCLAALAGLFYAIPALRLGGHYLALFTLLPPLILARLLVIFSDWTGGQGGLPNPDPLVDVGDFAADAVANYYLALGLLVAVFALTWVITRSDTGRIFTAIREDTEAVQSAGFNPAKYKVYSMVLSAVIGGFVGAVFVHTQVGSASPSQLLELTLMLEIILASIIGGFGTITGGLLGGLLIYWGLEFLRGIEFVVPVVETSVGDVASIIFFTILLLLVYFLEEGVLPWSYRIGNRVLTRARTGTPVADGGESNAAPTGRGRDDPRRRAAGRDDGSESDEPGER
jgi:branched-chain amino acid transport system permease protein